MKIGKLDINNWNYDGDKLRNPFDIIWRLFWWIPYKLFQSLAFISLYIGQGKSTAQRFWDW